MLCLFIREGLYFSFEDSICWHIYMLHIAVVGKTPTGDTQLHSTTKHTRTLKQTNNKLHMKAGVIH